MAGSDSCTNNNNNKVNDDDTAMTTMTATTTTIASESSAPLCPRRFIYNDTDLQSFLESPIKKEFLHFVSVMGNSCRTSSYQYDVNEPLLGLSPAIASFYGSLQIMKDEWVDEIPPLQPSATSNAASIRFGNPAFRTWHQRLTERAPNIVAAMLHAHRQQQQPNGDADGGEEYDGAILRAAMENGRRAASSSSSSSSMAASTALLGRPLALSDGDESNVQELACYLRDAFGHPIRLDYGTGHECSLQIFLFAACRLHWFAGGGGGDNENNKQPTAGRMKAICLVAYQQYLAVTRRLQILYRLEPAGSHGVWGLDDYYCLAFYFGACQLQQLRDDDTNNNNNNDADDLSSPRCIHDDVIVRDNKDRYLYLGCIDFIKQIKKNVPFGESSPMLNDISYNMSTWDRVAAGLYKLFDGEVLKKRPVVQHLKFGQIFRATWTPSSPDGPAPPPTAAFQQQHDFTAFTKAPWAK